MVIINVDYQKQTSEDLTLAFLAIQEGFGEITGQKLAQFLLIGSLMENDESVMELYRSL